MMLELIARKCLNHGCARVPPCDEGPCQEAREAFAPAPLHAETAPAAQPAAQVSGEDDFQTWIEGGRTPVLKGAICPRCQHKFGVRSLTQEIKCPACKYERPAARHESPAPAEPLLSRQMLIGGLVNKWSGNDEIKASDFLEWVMSQPLAAAPARAVQSTAMNQAADLLAESMMLADADRVRSGALVVQAHNMLVGTHAIEQPEPARSGDKLWCETCNGTGRVHEEHQRGVVGSGGDHPCPDCDGRGYWTRRAAPATAKRTFATCESIGGQYRVVIGFASLAEAQAAHLEIISTKPAQPAPGSQS